MLNRFCRLLVPALIIMALHLLFVSASYAAGYESRLLPDPGPAGNDQGPVLAGYGLTPLSFTPAITATKTDSLAVDNDGDNQADPGDTLQYTVVISNDGTTPATGLVFSDTLDASLTLSGTVQVSPVALDDVYFMGTSPETLSIADGPDDLFANDFPGQNPAVTGITSFGGGALGGSVEDNPAGSPVGVGTSGSLTVNADGSFTFAPDDGFEGDFTFLYRLENSVGPSDGLVTISVDSPPTVTTTSPVDGAPNVAPNTTIIITFSESVNVAAGAVSLECPETIPIDFAPPLPRFGVTNLELDPIQDLPGNTTCRVTIEAGGVADTDTSDPPDTMLADYSFTFTVAAVANNDLYPVSPHLTLAITATNGVLTNDVPVTATITGYGPSLAEANANLPGTPVTTTLSGQVTLNGDGGFTYLPPPNASSTVDRFYYTLDGGNVAEVTLNIQPQNLIWFIDAGYDGGNGPGDGTQARPFTDLTGPGSFDLVASDNDGDYIFIADGVYTCGLALLDNQTLVGDGAPVTLSSFTGVTPVSGSSLPLLSGINPVLSAPAGDCLTLGSGNTIRGLTVSDTPGGFALASGAGSIGTATIRDTSITGSGGLFSLTSGGDFNADFEELSSTGAPGTVLHLAGTGGTINNSSGSISHAVSISPTVLIDGDDPSLAYTGNITKTTGGRLIDIRNTSGAGITFSGNLSQNDPAGMGILVANNSNGTNVTFSGASKVFNTGANTPVTINDNPIAAIRFSSGGLDITTTDAEGFTAGNSGLLEITGGSNTISTTANTALNVFSTTISSAGLTFRSISASGAVNGITLTDTGDSGGLTVTGTGTPGSGGVIQEMTDRGASFTNAVDIELQDMNFTNAATTNGPGCGDLAAGDNQGCHAAIHLHNVTDVLLDGLNIAGSEQVGINLNTVTGLTVSNVNIQTIGNETLESGIKGFNVLGSVDINDTNIAGSFDDNVSIHNDLGQAAWTVTASDFNTSQEGSGFRYVAAAGAEVNLDIQANNFTGNPAAGIDLLLDDSSTVTGTLTGIIAGNTISTLSAAPGNGINIVSGGSGVTTVLVDDNDVSNLSLFGIFAAAQGSSTLNTTLISNTVTTQSDAGSTPQDGIRINAGVTDTDNGTVCAQITGNQATGAAAFGSADIRLDHLFDLTFQLPGLPGSTAAEAETFVAANNPLSGVVQVITGTTSVFTGGAPCPQPPTTFILTQEEPAEPQAGSVSILTREEPVEPQAGGGRAPAGPLQGVSGAAPAIALTLSRPDLSPAAGQADLLLDHKPNLPAARPAAWITPGGSQPAYAVQPAVLLVPGATPAGEAGRAPLALSAPVNIGDLPPGKVVTITFQVVIDDPLSPGVNQVTNQGQISATNISLVLTDDPDTPEPNDPTVTAIDLETDLVIDKQVTPEEPDRGEAITYTLAYTNAGTNLVRGVVITDPLPAQLLNPAFTSSRPVTPTGTYTWDAGNLIPGESGRITITAQIDPNELLGTQIDNTAAITAPNFVDIDPENNVATATLTVAEPSLTLTKTLVTSSAGVDAGDTVRYELTIQHDAASNTGAFNLNVTDTFTSALQNLIVVDAFIDDGTATTVVTDAFSIDPSGLLQTVGPVNLLFDAGAGIAEMLVIQVEGRVTDSISASALITNTATVTWEKSSGAQSPDNIASGSAEVITVPAVFSVTKSVLSPGAQVAVGDTITYQLETEVIEGTTTNLQFVDTLPAGLSYVSGSAVVSNTNGMTVSGFDAIQAGQVLTLTIDSVVNPGAIDAPADVDTGSFFITYQALVNDVPGNESGVDLTNTVDASADNVPADTGNQTTVGIVSPLLAIDKEVDNDTPAPGETVTYQLTISHAVTSTAEAYDVVVTDTIPSGLVYVPGSATTAPPAQVDASASPVLVFTIPSLALGSSSGFSYQATVAAPPDADLGSELTNVAQLAWTSVPGVEPGERVSTATVSETVTVTGVGLRLVKSAEPAAALPGQAVTYTLVFSNSGNVSATDVTIRDEIPAELIDLNVTSSGADIVDSGAVPPYLWTVEDLLPGDGGTIIITGRIDPGLAAGTTLTNTAEISGTGNADLVNNIGQAAIDVRLPQVSFSSAAYEVGEPAGPAVVTATLDIPNPFSEITVQFATADGTASAGSDYTPVTGTLTFPAGTTTATFTVPISDDTEVESAETIMLSLDSPAGATLGSPAAATLTIIEDDQPPVTPIFLPTILKDFAPPPGQGEPDPGEPDPGEPEPELPDLVVESLTASSSEVTVVLRNQGAGPATAAFWVDVYFDPRSAPAYNIPWYDIADHGVVWAVTGDGLSQLAPGGSLTLTLGDSFYSPEFSSTPPFPSGVEVFALVDAINLDTDYGAVLESIEANNLIGPVTSSAGLTGTLPALPETSATSFEELPAR